VFQDAQQEEEEEELYYFDPSDINNKNMLGKAFHLTLSYKKFLFG
jgi:hypothetical protein